MTTKWITIEDLETIGYLTRKTAGHGESDTGLWFSIDYGEVDKLLAFIQSQRGHAIDECLLALLGMGADGDGLENNPMPWAQGYDKAKTEALRILQALKTQKETS